MEKQKIVMWAIIGILLVAVLYTVFFKVQTTGNFVNSGGKLDISGWTENEIMNYEMHGTIPSRFQSTGAVTSNNQMVGGC
ncbi:MAG: hypothetical protein WD876_00450 [Candidatus Pacearchaeota archaeon]